MAKYFKKFNENWKDKDDKKNIGQEDRDYVSCSEEWEKDPIVNKIKEMDSNISDEEIGRAFKQCCKEVNAPRPRSEFETCMFKKLGLQ